MFRAGHVIFTVGCTVCLKNKFTVEVRSSSSNALSEAVVCMHIYMLSTNLSGSWLACVEVASFDKY